MSEKLIIVLLLVGGVLVWAVLAYNQLVALRNRFQNAFAQIDVQLKRRYELIPNLVESAKAYMAHERGALQEVIAARNSADAARQSASTQPENVQAVREWLGTSNAASLHPSRYRGERVWRWCARRQSAMQET